MLFRSGSYDQWGGVLRGLLAWLEARRLTPAGPIREVFLQFSAGDFGRGRLPSAYLVDQPGEFLTEMQIPVRAAAKGRPRVARAGRSPARGR